PHERNPTRFPEHAQADGTHVAYAHMNPFRGSLVILQSSHDLRLEVNVPDEVVELWRDSVKTATVKLKTPWLRLTFPPVLPAASAGAFVACLLSLFGTAPEPRPDAPPRASPVALAALFAFGAVATVLFADRVYHHLPGFGDEINYLFEAKVMAAGRL